jgi:2-keto-4-pentenoate hydratase/2-oxohepta-3-ene-1,7-dioic acid hydratase in catechol pathway
MYSQNQRTRVGLVAGDQVLDLAAADAGMPAEAAHDMRSFLEAGPEMLDRAAGVLARWQAGQLPPDIAQPYERLALLAPVPNPSKVVAVGINYGDHCREAGMAPPQSPVLFCKFPTSVIGPGAAIEWDPALTAQVDYEAELAVVIGRRARRVPAEQALQVVFGYTCGNDVTARDLQRGDGQWVRGKSLDTFCPLGPALVTRDEVPDPGALAIACRLNGQTMQDSNTREMIFDVPALIEFMSRAFTLLPGDVILTGTPHGVGVYRQPPALLGDADLVEVEVEGLGVLANPCRTL